MLETFASISFYFHMMNLRCHLILCQKFCRACKCSNLTSVNLTEVLEGHGKAVVSQYGAVCNSVLTILREHLNF